MAYFIVTVLSALLLGSSYVDGPMYPPLDLMLQILCRFQTYIGIGHVWPLLLTFEPADDQVLSLFTDWFTIEAKAVLAFLLWGLSIISLCYILDWMKSPTMQKEKKKKKRRKKKKKKKKKIPTDGDN